MALRLEAVQNLFPSLIPLSVPPRDILICVVRLFMSYKGGTRLRPVRNLMCTKLYQVWSVLHNHSAL